MSFDDQPLSAETIQILPNVDAPEPVPTTIKDKWQGAVTEGSGFVAIPMALLRLQTKLKLTPTDMVVLVNLLAHWWDPARAVFLRSTTIATRIGCREANCSAFDAEDRDGRFDRARIPRTG